MSEGECGTFTVMDSMTQNRHISRLIQKVCEIFHKLLAMSFRRMFNAPLTDEISGLSGLRAGKFLASPVPSPSLCGGLEPHEHLSLHRPKFLRQPRFADAASYGGVDRVFGWHHACGG